MLVLSFSFRSFACVCQISNYVYRANERFHRSDRFHRLTPPGCFCRCRRSPSRQEVYHRRTPSESIANTYTPGVADLRLGTMHNSERFRARPKDGARRCSSAKIDLSVRPSLQLVRAAGAKRKAAEQAKVGERAEK